MKSSILLRFKERLYPVAIIGILALAIFPASGWCDYTTPGTGVNWTLDQLVANSGGAVTGASPNYQVNEYLFVSEGDTLTIAPSVETTVVISESMGIVISGALQVQGTDIFPVLFTGMDQTEGAWDAIYVTENGMANMAYAQVEFAEIGLYFDRIASTAPGSVINHCLIQNCLNPGIVVDEYAAPTFTLANSVIANNGDAGLWLEYIGKSAVNMQGNWFYDNQWSGVAIFSGNPSTVIQGNAFTENDFFGVEVIFGGYNLQIRNNLIVGTDGAGIGLNTGTQFSKDGGYYTTGGEQTTIQSNIIAGNHYEGIYSYYSSGHNIAYNVIAENGMGIYLDHSWNSLVAMNTIGECSLDGSLFSMDTMDLPFGYNAALAEQLGGDPENWNLDANEGSGVFVENSIPGLGAEPVSYAWIEVNANNADNWMAYEQIVKDEDLNDEYMDEAAIGFDFPVSYTAALESGTYTHFSMNSNGVVELVQSQYATEGYDDYESRGYFTRNYPESTFLFANADDWIDTGIDAYQTHNGQQVRMNGFGYRHFQAGDLDGDGNTVKEECLVFRWFMESWFDSEHRSNSQPLWNDFQAVLYPDGRIRWNTKANNAKLVEYGAYCGLYAGGNPVPVEIMAGNNPGSSFSYLFDPQKARDISTQIVGNTMLNNAQEQQSQPKGDQDQGPPGIEGNVYLYDAYFVGMRSNTLESNVKCVQLDGQDDLETTIHFNNITSFQSTERRVPAVNGWISVENYAGGCTDARYNFWDAYGDPDAYVNGCVTIDPWLASAVPGPEEAGILLFHPFNVDSNGTVITVTSGTYPGMSLVIPIGAVDYEEPNGSKAPITSTSGITFTMGELLPVPELPSYMEGVGIPFVFTPSGQVFSVPVTITMPYKGFTPPTHVYYYDMVNATWNTDGVTVVSVDQVKRTVTFTAAHFTTFAAGLTKSAGGDDGNPPYHYHRRDVADDHLFPCFVGSLAGNGSIPFLPAALAMLLAALGVIRKRG
ncbi:MAG: right-handed parallel beta-helix repeat-containing protein [Desulfatibacillum sp.]|nr:right-handed parallel beta-helix repeat-containing protein [Desulfatibacillum sp.]